MLVAWGLKGRALSYKSWAPSSERRVVLDPDRLINAFDKGLRTLFAPAQSQRPMPKSNIAPFPLNAAEKRLSGALMRVNHSGEVCAQALYQGQALVARDLNVRASLAQAAAEEMDHLNWCECRLRELSTHKSYLNPIWYVGSFSIGIVSGILGDRWNLGFLAETERQVEQHLSGHLHRLPIADTESRVVVTQMQVDEVKHATTALNNGARELPISIQKLMRGSARVMTNVSFWV